MYRNWLFYFLHFLKADVMWFLSEFIVLAGVVSVTFPFMRRFSPKKDKYKVGCSNETALMDIECPCPLSGQQCRLGTNSFCIAGTCGYRAGTYRHPSGKFCQLPFSIIAPDSISLCVAGDGSITFSNQLYQLPMPLSVKQIQL